jgi:predicted dehydrogenase
MKPIPSSGCTGEDVVTIRLGVIGAGTISQAIHLPAARRLASDIELTAIHDLSPQRTREVAHSFGARPAESAEALISAADVDAVVIATPGSHAELTTIALHAGKHVLAEKPLALTIADVRRLDELATEHGVVLQVGYMKMYDPAVAVAAERRGDLGDLGLARITVLHPADAPQVAHVRVRPHADGDPRAVDRAVAQEIEATRRAIGDVHETVGHLYRGQLNGSLIHELSVLRALGFSLPTTFSHVELWPWPAEGSPPSLLAVAPLEGEAQLVLSWNWLPELPEYREEVALFGSRGRLHLDMAPPYLLEERSTLRIERTAAVHTEELAVRAGRDSAFVCQLERFVAAIRGDEPVLSTAAGAIEDLRCLQGLVRTVGDRLGFEVGGEASRADRTNPPLAPLGGLRQQEVAP